MYILCVGWPHLSCAVPQWVAQLDRLPLLKEAIEAAVDPSTGKMVTAKEQASAATKLQGLKRQKEAKKKVQAKRDEKAAMGAGDAA